MAGRFNNQPWSRGGRQPHYSNQFQSYDYGHSRPSNPPPQQHHQRQQQQQHHYRQQQQQQFRPQHQHQQLRPQLQPQQQHQPLQQPQQQQQQPLQYPQQQQQPTSGFVVQGQVQPRGNPPPAGGSAAVEGGAEVIDLSSSDEEDNGGGGGGGGYDEFRYNAYDHNVYELPVPRGAAASDSSHHEEIQLLRVLPKSKSRLLPPLPEDTGIDVTYDSSEMFTAASVTDYGHERPPDVEAWSLDSGVKQGYVKEYVEKNGMGMIFSIECGLILFNDKQFYSGPDGGSAPAGTIGAGSHVSFVCYQIQSTRCRGWVTEDGFMRQAAAVWEPKLGNNHAGQNLLRAVTSDQHKAELKKDFEGFLSHIKENRFLPIALVRARGQIVGYLNHKIGIIETEDGRRPNCRVLFHSSDVYLFKNPVALSGRRDPIDVLLPVGLKISFDARSIRGDDPMSSDVPYQACAVFAGTWPKVPHPTLLPGGPGSYAPVYDGENTQDYTFYYLQLGLTANLDKKWRTFKDSFWTPAAANNHNGHRFNFVRSQVAIRSGRDFAAWKTQYSPYPVQSKPRPPPGGGGPDRPRKFENHHKFKRNPPKETPVVKQEAEAEKDTPADPPPRVKNEPGMNVKQEQVG